MFRKTCQKYLNKKQQQQTTKITKERVKNKRIEITKKKKTAGSLLKPFLWKETIKDNFIVRSDVFWGRTWRINSTDYLFSVYVWSFVSSAFPFTNTDLNFDLLPLHWEIVPNPQESIAYFCLNGDYFNKLLTFQRLLSSHYTFTFSLLFIFLYWLFFPCCYYT